MGFVVPDVASVPILTRKNRLCASKSSGESKFLCRKHLDSLISHPVNAEWESGVKVFHLLGFLNVSYSPSLNLDSKSQNVKTSTISNEKASMNI